MLPAHLREHRTGLSVTPLPTTPSPHPAKYAAGLATALIGYAGTDDVGDPMAGTGRIAEETRLPIALNEISPRWRPNLMRLKETLDCPVSFEDAQLGVPWQRETLIFSPPYYPKADRCKPASHNDDKRGPVVGFRDSYGDGHLPGFIGDPAGRDAILLYRHAMRRIFKALAQGRTRRMILVTKNWIRLGVELRLDLDLFLTAKEAGWRPEARTGWIPPASLWARYNERRGGMITVEDVLVLTR